MKLDNGNTLRDAIVRFIDTVGEVPFGNSDWQNRQTIVNRELTPERAYRHASLRIMNRLEALTECYYDLGKKRIEIKKLERKRAAEQDELERDLIELEINKLQSLLPYTEKLVKDAILEIESLLPVIDSMGKLTREQFESAESKHFKRRYELALLGRPEEALGLELMGYDLTDGKKKTGFLTLFDEIKNRKQLEAEKEEP